MQMCFGLPVRKEIKEFYLKSMSIVATLPVFMFSNAIALEQLLSEPIKDIASQEFEKLWRSWVFTASLQRDSSRPEHVFDMRWKKYSTSCPTDIVYALRCVGKDYLHVRSGKLWVKSKECFTRWQNLRGRISTLPVKVLIAYEAGVNLEPMLCYPHNKLMQDYIESEGLNECHMHLNGYRYPEECWLDALYNIHPYITSVSKKLRSDWALREMYKLVNPNLTPARQYMRMKFALYIRHILLFLCGLDDEGEIEELCSKTCEKYRQFVNNPRFLHLPLKFITPNRAYLGSLRSEIQLWQQLFSKMERYEASRKQISFLAQLYLLILNEFIQLSRHNESNNGFAPFDKTCTMPRLGVGGRKYYHAVFTSILRNSHARKKNCIEIRLTPDAIIENGTMLIKQWKECCNANASSSVPQLVVVGHFIKEKATTPTSILPIAFPVHSKLAAKYIGEAERLAKFARTEAALHEIPIGVDAANAEQNVPADVFAPAFRHFERLSHSPHKTFHCGEDFLHLLSGIRAVSEAVNFLSLSGGNRVGHATAIGIDPQLWLNSMPSYIVMSRGEWLLNLIFARKEILRFPSNELSWIESEAMGISNVVFSSMDIPHDIHSLSQFYDARHLLPVLVRCFLRGRQYPQISSFVRTEMDIVASFAAEFGTPGLEILNYWHYNYEVKKKADELIEVPTDAIPVSVLISLQQSVQRLLKHRNVVIECPLVSNLRVSQYTNVEQHHILRWLGIRPLHPDDEKMGVCLGSDDPGIFVTDIQNEYQHLYNILEKADVPKSEIMEIIRHVGHMSRVFSFHPPVASCTDSLLKRLQDG